MKTYILRTLTEGAFTRVGELLHMLDAGAPALDFNRLQALAASDQFNLFVAEDENGTIAGMLTLTCCPTLSRSKWWIEDVIVDPSYRGQGVGRALVQAAVAYVKETDASPTLYLTSNPSRVSARRLYVSEGFEEYETGVFRLPRV